MKLTNTVSTKRRILRTTREALRFIESELPIELRLLPRWTFAKELLVEAHLSQKQRDLKHAYRQPASAPK